MHRDSAEPTDKTGAMGAGLLVLEMVSTLESRGIHSVYLRNYEDLPHSVGNDVDLLVPLKKRGHATDILKRVAKENRWSYLGCGHFSPIALYFGNIETGETLHVDLLDRIEWHFLEFADAEGIVSRRAWNGMVHIPAPQDEIYLNITGRLIYQGAVRDKHRRQAADFASSHDHGTLRDAFAAHLGPAGGDLFKELMAAEWKGTAASGKQLKKAAFRKFGPSCPLRLLTGMARYGKRSFRKILSPPGRFLVLEGADGVGKSTVLAALLPWCGEWCAGRDTYHFHWKPVAVSAGLKHQVTAVDPRGRGPRNPVASLLYLSYHLIGFWLGWIRHVYPLLVRSHAVVGDRYSYDLYLDPERFRLRLPLTLCRMAALAVPRPEVTVALVASPEIVHARKPELTMDEIARYQERWESLSVGRPRMVTVSAEGDPQDVIRRVKQAILKVIADDA